MKAYSETKQGTDGLAYNVRYLLDPSEAAGLHKAGLIGDITEIIGMQEVADSLVAGCEKQAFTACGGTVQ